MPLGWLYPEVHPGIAVVLAALLAHTAVVSPLWTVWRRRRGKASHGYGQWVYWTHLAVFAILLVAVPGVDADNLGLGRPARGWAAGLGISAAVVAIVMLGTVRARAIYTEAGVHVHWAAREMWRYVVTAAVGCTRDAFLFVVAPLFVGVGVFRLPLFWVAVGAALAYGFHHLAMGWVAVVQWTACAAVALFVYLLSASAALPTVVIAAAALIPLCAWPRGPVEPPAEPVLTVVEPPAPQ